MTEHPTPPLFPSLNHTLAERYLLPVATISMGIGLILAPDKTSPAGELLPVAAAIILLICFYGRIRFYAPIAALFFFSIGFFHPGFNPDLERADHIAHQITSRQELTLSGVLHESPSRKKDRWTLVLQVKSFLLPGQKFVQASGLVQLSTEQQLPDDIFPGDHLLARVVIGPPKNFHNPGQFDYRRYLAAQGIYLTGAIRPGATLLPVTTPASQSFSHTLRYFPERCRYRISRFLDNTLPPEVRGIYKALLIGDRGELSDRIDENFKATGCIHLLAISGTHMGLLAFLVTAAVFWLMKRSEWILLHLPARKIAVIAAILPLVAYSLIAGFNIPVIRSLFMTLALFLAIILNRQHSLLNAISLAALLLLVLYPDSLFTVSFQLSFSAVIGIALFFPHIARLFPAVDAPKKGLLAMLARYVIISLCISLAATFSTLPLLLYYFNRLSLLSPLSTLLVEPVLCIWSLVLGLAGCSLIPILPKAAELFFQLGASGLRLADMLTEFMAGLPGISWYIATPQAAAVGGYYGALILLANLHLFKHSRLVGGFSLTVLAGLLIWQLGGPRYTSQTTIHYLDVGQGSASVIQLPGNLSILIDGGSASGSRFDPGRMIIAPFLWQHGIQRLDHLVITHPHADHYNGLAFIIDMFRPQTLWVSTTSGGGQAYQQILKKAGAMQTAIKVPEKNQVLLGTATTQLREIGGLAKTFSPANREGKKNRQEENNRSLVLALQSNGFTLLFPGDIEQEAEALLVHDSRLKTDVLLAPHHGSINSNSDAFIAATAPDHLIVSSSAYSSALFPSPDVLRRYRQHGAALWPIAQCGAITAEISSQGLQMTSTLPCREKFKTID